MKKYCQACLNCLYKKNSSGRKPGYLYPIEKVSIPFHTLHIDHVGPFIRSTKKNTEILTIVDGFTKFHILEPVKDTKTKYVLRILDTLFNTFGVPARIISDRGSCFTSHKFEKFCLENGIKHIRNATATPRANGQAERSNHTILAALAATSGGAPEEQWDRFVKLTQSAINTSTNRTTQRSPAQLLFGYKPRSAAEAPLLAEIQSTLDEIDLQTLREQAKGATEVEQVKQKTYFDKKRCKPPVYKIGDTVMVDTEPPSTGESRKLASKAKGPFKVTAVLPNDRYEVQDLRDMSKSKGQKSVRAVDSLKKWVMFDPAASS